MNSNITVSILGCGWLGLPLGIRLSESGYRVMGSTTDRTKIELLRENNIEPFVLSANPGFEHEPVSEFFRTDVLVINIPPPRRSDVESFHRKQIENIIRSAMLSGTKKILFVSSTSVYPSVNRVVTESDDLVPEKASGRALKIVEEILMNSDGFETTLLRLAGLIGYDRNPSVFLKKRKPRRRANLPVNLIHRDDCVEIILKIIETDMWGEVLNACCDTHPLRRDFYVSQTGDNNVDIVIRDESETTGYKIVSNEKLKKLLGYRFIHPDPLEL